MPRQIRWLLLLSPLLTLHTALADGIVSGIVKAPVVPDGTTAGRPTDFVINLDRTLDPSVDGRTLLQGKSIRITLPADFENTEGWPFIGIGPDCGPPLSGKECNTGVLLQGWPQNPINPATYEFSYEPATNTIVYTALEDLVPAGLGAPGIKQMHLFLLGFTNPHPGHYPVIVEAETGPGGALETGWARVHIIPKPRPSVNVTSVNPDNPPPRLSTIYQQTTVGNAAPLNYNFLLWDRNDEPFGGVDLYDLGADGHYLLRQGNRVVGHVAIDAPPGAVGQALMSFGPSMVEPTVVFGPPSMTARWAGSFIAGSEPGRYTVSFRLNGGNEVNMFVDVTE